MNEHTAHVGHPLQKLQPKGKRFIYKMESRILILVFAAFCASSTVGNPTGQRFQAEKFLDMLARTFDEKTAFMDLYAALQRRLGIDPASTQNGTGNASPVDGSPAGLGGLAENNINCPDAPRRSGATIAYTSDSHVTGSRAFYECNPGYNGRSLFIQCLPGGIWSSIGSWSGCTPVDCGPSPPSVANADASVTSTTYKSVVFYNCRQGYKMDSTGNNVTCMESGQWGTPTFKCNNVPSASTGGLNMALLSSMMSAMGGSNGQEMPMPIWGRQFMPTASYQPQQLPTPTPHISPPVPIHQTGPYDPMQALMNSMGAAGGAGGLSSFGGNSGMPSGSSNNMNNMMSMFGQIFPGFGQTPTTTTTPKPPTPSFGGFGSAGGFQLPSHLQGLLPNGLSNTQGFKPQDLIALTSAGLGSGTGAGPRDITSLLSSMNPMAMMTPGGMGGQMTGRGRGPVDPEKMAEQREEMMMRAAMAGAMKSIMGGPQSGNGTSARNPAMDMITLMALQNGLGGGGGGSGMEGMMPMMGGGAFAPMMGFGGGGLFSSPFGGAK